MSNSLQLHRVHGILQARILEWVAFPFSNPGVELGSPALQANFLPGELWEAQLIMSL